MTIDENIHHKIYVYMVILNLIVDPNKYNIHYHWVWEKTYKRKKNMKILVNDFKSTNNFVVEKDEEL